MWANNEVEGQEKIELINALTATNAKVARWLMQQHGAKPLRTCFGDVIDEENNP